MEEVRNMPRRRLRLGLLIFLFGSGTTDLVGAASDKVE